MGRDNCDCVLLLHSGSRHNSTGIRVRNKQDEVTKIPRDGMELQKDVLPQRRHSSPCTNNSLHRGNLSIRLGILVLKLLLRTENYCHHMFHRAIL